MNQINALDKELADLKGFIVELKADRAAQKERERREAWTKYTSMSLVFIAALAAVAIQLSGKYGGQVLVNLNQSTFQQALASDQWSYYQAKSIKHNLYEALRDSVPKEGDAKSQAAFDAKVEKYKADEADIMKKARQCEADRDAARTAATRAGERGGQMANVVSAFQVAIALGSICLVTKKRPLWYLALTLSAIATARMLQIYLS